mgnify:CR=1 FL=1
MPLKLIDKIIAIVQKNRRWVYTSTIALVILSFIGMSQLKNVGYMLDDISKSDKLYQDLKFFEKNVNSEISKMILKSDYYEKLKSLSWRYEETPKFFVNTNYKNWSIELTIKKTIFK